MRKILKAALSILMMLTVFTSAAPYIYAADTTENRGSSAYAIFNSDTGEMDFIRSEENHATGTTGTVKSISGETYTGTIYTNFENNSQVPWAGVADKVKTVKFINPISPVSTFLWFNDMSNCTSMDLRKLDTTSVTTMRQMFSDCSSLQSIDISNFDTSKVTDMYAMFRDCTTLTSLDVSNFDTSNVTNMSQMFYNCQKVPVLDVSHFDTSKVEDMSWMFYGCWEVQSLNLSNFDTTKTTDTTSMFYGCHNITTLDVSCFNTSNVKDMQKMFADCFALKNLQLDASKFDTSKVTNMSAMFSNCKVLQSIDVSHFNTSNVTDMSNMFTMCNALKELDVSNFDTSKVTNMSAMFSNCNALQSIDVSHFNTSNVTNMSYLFSTCKQLSSIDVSHFDTSNATNMAGIFGTCEKLSSIDTSNFNTSKVTNMSAMFSSCFKLPIINVSHFDTSKVTNMYAMFSGCNSVKELDVSRFDTSKVTNMQYMFANCNMLRSLDLSSFDTSKVTNMKSMFFSPNSKISKMTFGNKFKIASFHPSMFSTPTTTESGKKASGLWGLGSEAAEITYTADHLATYGASKIGALSGTWYAQTSAYTIRFDSNEGSGSMDSQSISGSASLNANTFAREGYKFTGWNTKPDGTGKSYANTANITPSSDMTLYAQWKYIPVIVKVPKAVKYDGVSIGNVNINESYDVIVDCENSYTVTVKGNVKKPTSGSNELSASAKSTSSSLIFDGDGTKKEIIHISGNAKYGKYTGYVQYAISSIWKK